MISSNLLRTASRRLVSSTSSQAKRSSSSTRQAIKCASDQEARMVLPIMTAATLACGWGLLTSRENGESKSAQCLVSRTDTKAKEVEAKFAAYWPRNIMILFGPPGRSIVCIYFIVLSLLSLSSVFVTCRHGALPKKNVTNGGNMNLNFPCHFRIRRRKGNSRAQNRGTAGHPPTLHRRHAPGRRRRED